MRRRREMEGGVSRRGIRKARAFAVWRSSTSVKRNDGFAKSRMKRDLFSPSLGGSTLARGRGRARVPIFPKP